MDPYMAMILAQGGGNVLGNLLSFLGGSGDRSRLEQAYRGLGKQMGKPVYDLNKITAMNRRTAVPRAQQLGEVANRQFGLDQGQGRGYFLNQLYNQENQFNLGATMENQRLMSDRDMKLAMARSQLAAQMAR